ncbi:MAG: zinc ribbon domain-containing protein [Actinobacteria bacterium]|nr:zinc ribbon domain-containing protein [Actinomycetota bacterium]
MYCPNCGAANPEGAKFCMNCRADLSAAREAVGTTARPSAPAAVTVPAPAVGTGRALPTTRLAAIAVAALLLLGLGYWGFSTWSPDGKKVAYSVYQASNRPGPLYVANVDGTGAIPMADAAVPLQWFLPK